VFTLFEVVITKRSPTKWENGNTILTHGWEYTRRTAKYQGDRALFLLLAAAIYGPPQPP
jgi:hypothetical protein